MIEGRAHAIHVLASVFRDREVQHTHGSMSNVRLCKSPFTCHLLHSEYRYSYVALRSSGFDNKAANWPRRSRNIICVCMPVLLTLLPVGANLFSALAGRFLCRICIVRSRLLNSRSLSQFLAARISGQLAEFPLKSIPSSLKNLLRNTARNSLEAAVDIGANEDWPMQL